MPNLVKPVPVQWQSPPKPDDFPVYHHNGTNYRIVPECDYKKLQSDKDGAIWLYFGVGFFIAALASFVASWVTSSATATPQPMIIEKPVIVEREKLVPTNCLLFCGR